MGTFTIDIEKFKSIDDLYIYISSWDTHIKWYLNII